MEKTNIIQFWKKFATMIDNGVPLVATLQTLAAEQADNPFGKTLQAIIDDLKNGIRFSEALAKHPRFFDPALVQTVAGGESQGRLATVATTIGQKLDEGIFTVPDGSNEPTAIPTAEPDGPSFYELISRAVAENASDVHFDATTNEDNEQAGRVRFRIDGLLTDRGRHCANHLKRLIATMKAKACLDVTVTHLPQDGRIVTDIAGERIDLRVSTGPTVSGEAGCIRILRRTTIERVFTEPERVFPEPALREALFEAARAPYGLIVAAGPTGSGKTTTVYSLLARQDTERCKVMTVEDPVELAIPGAHQVQIKPTVGLSFPAALRHFMRMDPDVIFCSEIREVETASLLLKIALTGHLVFTQLHTKDALGVITRLLDLGLEPYLVADSLIGAIGQRLVRRLCTHCRRPSSVQRERLQDIADRPIAETTTVFEAVGCEACSNTGYHGRRAVYEYLPMTDGVKKVLRPGVTSEEILAAALRDGFVALRQNAVTAVASGDTTLSELLRVC